MKTSIFYAVRRLVTVRPVLTSMLLIAFLATSTSPVLAAGGQVGNLQGTIVDSQTKAPIAGAAISLAAPSGSYSAKSNDAGFFTILGIPVDTYVISVQAVGYPALSQAGITITGDQTVGLGNISLTKTLKTIGRVSSRSINGAFQPTQTIDSYTISGDRITQTTGKAATTDENSLLLAVPGVTLTNSGSPSIRGGGVHEVGYQFDGVNFVEPFLGNNGAGEATGGGLFNGIGSVQVVEGAGDATQGNIGSGVINLIPKRGTYPAFGYIDGEFGGPNYFHQFSVEYGFATRDNSLSDYIAYNGQRFNPYNGYSNQNASDYGSYFNTAYRVNDQFINNLVFKFGKTHNQSLQFLYSNLSSVGYGNYGGIPAPGSPGTLPYYPYDQITQSQFQAFAGYSPSQYASLIGLSQGTPGSASVPVTTPQVNDTLQTRFLKLEYDNNLSESTYLALRYYNWEQLDITDNSYSLGPSSASAPLYGNALVNWVATGGPTVGSSFDLTHQVGSKLTVTANGNYNVVRPIFDRETPQFGIFDLVAGYGPTAADWLPGGYIDNFFHGSPPRIPIGGTGYQGVAWQNYGAGLRFQYTPVNPVKLDLGVRYEGQNEHWINQLDQFGQGVPAGITPFDIPSQFWTASFLHPREYEPRAGLTWEIDRSDSLRFGYGRSAVFSIGQTAGTPNNLTGLTPFLSVPVPAGPGAPTFICGNPAGVTFPCKSYGAALYWANDAQTDYPDTGGGVSPAIYSNYDVSLSHQFANGWGARLTPFYKLGTDLPAFGLLKILPGGTEVFTSKNEGFNRTTGVEFGLTTPDRTVGVSGFLSATYQNVLSTTPPLSIAETAVPLLPTATLALGDVYRAGYVSPLSMRIGGTYHSKSGFSATPILQYNIGYPYSLGNLIAGGFGPGGLCPCANLPQVNFGPGVNELTQLQNQGGTQLSTNYYDPANPGTSTHPNIFVTRGTPATSATGGFLSPANLTANLTLQYKRAGNTFGVQMANLFGNAFIGSVPAVNPFYQPVATGLAGPQTGQNNCTPVFGTNRGCANIPKDTYAFTNGAYLLSNGDFTGPTGLAPLNPFTVTLFYQRAL